MLKVYNAIKDILDTCLAENSEYQYNEEPFIIDTSKQFIYGLDFPTLNTHSTEPKQQFSSYSSQNSPQTPPMQDITAIHFLPSTQEFYYHTQEIQDVEIEVDGKLTTQRQIQNYNEYTCRFALSFYTKTLGKSSSTKALQNKELFFNIFRNFNHNKITEAHGVFNIMLLNNTIQDISFVEGVKGVLRYQGSFTANLWQKTNKATALPLKNIKISQIKNICN